MNAPTKPRAETDPAAIATALHAAMRSAAVSDIFQRRLEQITKHGHTPAMDAHKPVGMLIRQMRDYADAAMDHSGPGNHVPADRLANARKHIITSAAMAIAIIDRIDIDLAQLRTEEGEAA